jgi:dipeptide/tripeptide permease
MIIKPQLAQWLMENVPWTAPFALALIAVTVALWFLTEGRGLLKYGPRYWRVTRKQAARRWKQKEQ